MIDTPFRLARRPRDDRGYVIPFVQFVDRDGKPDFRVLDAEKAQKAARRGLCAICGDHIRRTFFFIGGPLCVENGYFYDPPMHRECAIYCLGTCPHLARSKGRYASDEVVAAFQKPGFKLVTGDIDTSKKAEWFGLMESSGYAHGRDDKGMLMIKATLPWLSVEQWRDGLMMVEQSYER